MREGVSGLVPRPSMVSVSLEEHRRGRGSRSARGVCVLFSTLSIFLAGALPALAQQAETRQSAPAPLSFGISNSPQEAGQNHGPSTAPLTLTLESALERARANAPQFQAAVTAAKLAHEDMVQARAGLLPSASATTQYLYTQGNGKTPNGRFVSNDGVHVYRAWGVLHEDLSVNTLTLAGYRGATAGEALAKAQEEIARRGLQVTVTQAYYGLLVAQRKYAATQQSRDQAGDVLKISRDMEKQGQVAHSDVIKFQIQFNQQEEAFREANLAMGNARLNLAVLLFPTFNQDFSVVDDMDTARPLPSFEETEQLALKGNPQLAAASAALRQSNAGVSVARAAFFPTISLDVDYGIEANAFALRSVAASFPVEGKLPNLGYFATVALNVPVWDWGTRWSQLHQAEDRRQLAHLELTFAQRQTLANLHAYYEEASTARSEVDLLRNSADLAAESLRLNTLRYRSGEATVLELVDAQNTLTQAQGAYADGLARYRVALATLETLTGSF
jgi:outer membrane protein